MFFELFNISLTLKLYKSINVKLLDFKFVKLKKKQNTCYLFLEIQIKRKKHVTKIQTYKYIQNLN